jgi:hypothetical protein
MKEKPRFRIIIGETRYKNSNWTGLGTALLAQVRPSSSKRLAKVNVRHSYPAGSPRYLPFQSGSSFAERYPLISIAVGGVPTESCPKLCMRGPP